MVLILKAARFSIFTFLVEKGLILGRKRLSFALRENERDKIVTENGTDVDSFPKL
jgi:hypothetical protein